MDKKPKTGTQNNHLFDFENFTATKSIADISLRTIFFILALASATITAAFQVGAWWASRQDAVGAVYSDYPIPQPNQQTQNAFSQELLIWISKPVLLKKGQPPEICIDLVRNAVDRAGGTVKPFTTYSRGQYSLSANFGPTLFFARCHATLVGHSTVTFAMTASSEVEADTLIFRILEMLGDWRFI